MVKIVTPTAANLSKGSKIHGEIVERIDNSGKVVFGVMLEDKNLNITTGFLGGKKYGFFAARDLDTCKEAIELYGLSSTKPSKEIRVVYNETISPPQGDKSWGVVPMLFEEGGNLVKKEGMNVTSEGADVYRQSIVVDSHSTVQDSLVPHDKEIDVTNVTATAIEEAAKTTVK